MSKVDNVLAQVEGLGPTKTTRIKEAYPTFARLQKAASSGEIANLDGVGTKVSERIAGVIASGSDNGTAPKAKSKSRSRSRSKSSKSPEVITASASSGLVITVDGANITVRAAS